MRLQFCCVNTLESGPQLATEELLSPHLELTNFVTPEGRNYAQISRLKMTYCPSLDAIRYDSFDLTTAQEEPDLQKIKLEPRV